jgi:heme A synthase
VSTSSDPRHGALPADGEARQAPEHAFSLYGGHANSDADSSDRGFNSLVGRPAEMWAGAIFLTLAALPSAILGGGLAVQPGQFGANLRQKISSAGTSASADTLILLSRIGGAVLVVLAVLFVALAWKAVSPNSKARVGASVLAALQVAGLVVAVIVTEPDPASIGVGLLASAGAILLYLPRSEEFMNARR